MRTIATVGTINKPVKLNKQYATISSNRIVVNETTLSSYILENQNEVIELRIQKLISYLCNVSSVIIPAIGSEIDCWNKIDILVELQDETVLGFQIKAGKASASNARVFSKKNNIGVLYVDYDYNPIVLLHHLSRFLKLEIKQYVIAALNIVKLHRGKLLPAKMINLTNKQIEVLTTLQLIQVKGRYIQFK